MFQNSRQQRRRIIAREKNVSSLTQNFRFGVEVGLLERAILKMGLSARAYERINQSDKAREAYERGARAATSHGHPGMAEEYRQILESNS